LLRMGFGKLPVSVASLDQSVAQMMPYGQCCKTLYGRNLQLFVISYSVCPWQAFKLSLMLAIAYYENS
jgi:hypothetical protein